jgi:hypothetical protein
MRPRAVVLAVAVATATIAAAIQLAQFRSAVAQQVRPATPAPCTCPGTERAPTPAPRPRFAEYSQGGLDDSDEIAALDAIRIALTEVGDGASYVWHRGNGRLSGVIQPTASFKDAAGRICRHIVLVLTTGVRTGRTEGIACRLEGGRWQFEG